MKLEEYKQKVQKRITSRKVHLSLQIAQEIRKARIGAGLTQKQLAELIGTTQPSVARAERGKMLVANEYLLRVSRATNTHLTISLSSI